MENIQKNKINEVFEASQNDLIGYIDFKTTKSTQGEAKKISQNDFFKFFGSKEYMKEVENKDDVSLVLFAQTKDNRRKEEDIIYNTMFVLDDDDAKRNEEVYQELNKKGYSYALHSTFSSTKDNPRVRLFIIPNRLLTIEEYKVASRQLAKELNLNIDECSFKGTQLMYMPCYKKGTNDYFASFFEGKPVDVDDLLLRAKDAQIQEDKKNCKVPEFPTPKEREDGKKENILSCSTLKDAFNNYFCCDATFAENHLSQFYSDKTLSSSNNEIARYTRIGSKENGGLVLYNNSTYKSFHSNDTINKERPLTSYDLFKNKYNLTSKACDEYITTSSEFKEFRKSEQYKLYLVQKDNNYNELLKAGCWTNFPVLQFPLPGDFEIPQTEFLVDDLIIKNTVNFFVGTAGVGKSTLLNYITMSILAHRDIFNRKTHLDDAPKRALLINCEEGNQVIERLAKQQQEMNITEDESFEIITQNIINDDFIFQTMEDPNKRPSLIVIEPFRSLPKDLNSQKEVDTALTKWIERAQKYSITVCLIHHYNKDGEYSGSHVIRDIARILWNVERTNDGFITLTCAKSNCKMPSGLKLQRENDGFLFEYVDTISQQQEMEKLKNTAAEIAKKKEDFKNNQKRQILDLYARGMKYQDIATQLNLTYKKVYNVCPHNK